MEERQAIHLRRPSNEERRCRVVLDETQARRVWCMLNDTAAGR